MQVLYWDSENMSLMNPVTFEQTELPLAILGEQAIYLQDNMTVVVEKYKGAPANISLPTKVSFEVIEVTPLPSNSTNNNRDIPAKLSNGMNMRVPKFIKVGDKVTLATEDGRYLGKE